MSQTHGFLLLTLFTSPPWPISRAPRTCLLMGAACCRPMPGPPLKFIGRREPLPELEAIASGRLAPITDVKDVDDWNEFCDCIELPVRVVMRRKRVRTTPGGKLNPPPMVNDVGSPFTTPMPLTVLVLEILVLVFRNFKRIALLSFLLQL